jgi:hypothetical protein
MRYDLLVCGLRTLAAVRVGSLPQLTRQVFWAPTTLRRGSVCKLGEGA